MKRRSFIKSLAAFMILPSATTYARSWKRQANDLWMPFDPSAYIGECKWNSPWTGLIKRGEYPKGLGETIRCLTYERVGIVVRDPDFANKETITITL